MAFHLGDPTFAAPASDSKETGQSFNSKTPIYSAEAAQTILSKALELRAEERYTPQELQEMAAELDLSPELLEAAVAEWRSQPASTESTATAKPNQSPRRGRQWQHYALGSVLMIGIDFATAGTLTWAIFPVMGWGLGLLLGDDKCSSTRSKRPQHRSADYARAKQDYSIFCRKTPKDPYF